MYQITCPSCHTTHTSSFARTGAVTMCRSCGHKFALDSKNTRKEQMLSEPKQPAAEELLKESQIEQSRRQQAQQTIEEAREVTGLSGLSELASRENRAADKPTASSGLQPASLDMQEEIAEIAETIQTRKQIKRKKQKRASKRRGRNMGVMILMVVVVMITLGGMVGIYVFRDALWQTNKQTTNPDDESDDRDDTISPDGLRKHGQQEFFGT